MVGWNAKLPRLQERQIPHKDAYGRQAVLDVPRVRHGTLTFAIAKMVGESGRVFTNDLNRDRVKKLQIVVVRRP
jgi:hypothetical protein